MYTEAYNQLNRERNYWMTEEEVRLGWLHVLRSNLDIVFHAERGRSDADYNQVVIEFKDKGLFHGRADSAKFREAIYDRLSRYIPKKAENEGLDVDKYIGIAIDGDSIAFAYIPTQEAEIVHGPIMPLSLASVSLVFDICKFSTRRAVIADNLIEDFGHGSIIGQNLMQILSNNLVSYLEAAHNNKIKMLYYEWKTLYGQVADLSEPQANTILQSIGFTCNTVIPERFSIILFVIHTYNSIIIKLLAAEIVSKITSLTAYSDFAQVTASVDDDTLIDLLDSDIERAGLYTRANILGFVEEPLFSWYIDVYRDNLYPDNSASLTKALREILIRLSSYQIGDLSNAQANDVLKMFYQNLVPEVLRKSLGEFYTPDWLVEVALNKVSGNFSNLRFLDPTCGSASFLIAIIKRIRNEYVTGNTKKLLEYIIQNVWGFDLNPLAVQTSRVNYLIAISDLIQDNPGVNIEIPILLADAIYSPAPDPEGDATMVTYTIGSQVANLTITIPSALAIDREKLDAVFQCMSHCVENNVEPVTAINELVSRCILNHQEANEWADSLENTYARVFSLHQQHWNGIWFRIVRNYFWASTAGEFDVIVGNPPWVRWSKLPVLYRNRVKSTCMQYDIFSSTPYHGGNELDISAMITFTVTDKWLRRGGQLVFLLTQTLFQSASSEGFRRFKISPMCYLKPIEVNDLKGIKPFTNAANKTSIFVARKGTERPEYPIPYTIWKPMAGTARAIPEHITYQDILNRICFERNEAIPIANDESPWAIFPPGEHHLYHNLLGTCEWVNGRKGITCDLNGIYFVNVVSTSRDGHLVQIETRPNSGRTDIGPTQRFWIEPALLYPMIKGAGDLIPCGISTRSTLYAIIPNNGITNAAYNSSRIAVERDNPCLYNYFSHFEYQLKRRSTYRTRMQNAPFYAVYNVGSYTFALWKVVWAEQPGNRGFPVAVISNATLPGIGEKVIIPDHKIYFADFAQPEPAYYLCGLLSCSMVQRLLKSFLIMIQVGNIFQHMKLPEFDPSNSDHMRLVQLVRIAHMTNEIDGRRNILSKISEIGNRILSN